MTTRAKRLLWGRNPALRSWLSLSLRTWWVSVRPTRKSRGEDS